MGISVSEPTIARILKEHGFAPRPGRKLDFERVTSSVKDAVWALDFFAVKTAKGVWLRVSAHGWCQVFGVWARSVSVE